jgi:pyruvate/2-oxoglutarate dehydrogenase complex dihydrolipoamide dehydrogenase (E3) component
MPASFEAVVIGAGPAGEAAATRLSAAGLRTALVERELVGGECAYWACIPSKTLLRPAEAGAAAARAAGLSAPEQHWRELADYRDFMVRHLDDSEQVDGYRKEGVRVYKGEGRLAREHAVEVAGETLIAERIILAVGSTPRLPAIAGLQESGFWTNREATNLTEIPRSVIVLGGGPVGIELGQFLRRFGASVTIVQNGERLLGREEPRVSELITDALTGEGIELRLGVQATSVSRSESGRTVTLSDGAQASGQELLVATGRAPRTEGLGLETAGVQHGPGGIQIDERCRAGEGIWAIGDITGVMPFTHVAMYQARVACADIAGESPRADYGAIPRVVFCDPEVAAVGLTEAGARERGIEVAGAHVDLAQAISRPWTYERDPRGELGVLVDRRRRVLVGAWAVSPLASEWIHYAALAIKTQAPLELLRDTVAQFPTYCEGYLKAIEALEL